MVSINAGFRHTLSFAAILILLLAANCSMALPGNQIPDYIKENVRTRIDYGKAVGVVIGVINPGGKYCYGYGKTSLTGKKTPDEDTVFEIGSNTKVFTCSVLAQMVQQEILNLQDPIKKYLPASVNVSDYKDLPIRLVHLATHTAGFPRAPLNLKPVNPENPWADYTVEQMYDFLSEYSLKEEPGKSYSYSNYGLGLLGHILSLKNGMSYEEMISKYIGTPLSFKDTGISLTPSMRSRLAKGHRMGMEVENWDILTLAGAGGLRSTARDLLTFLGANLGLVKSGLYPALKATHEPKVEERGTGVRVGLGWHILTEGDTNIIWHSGSTGGYWCFMGFVNERKLGVVVLTNSNENINDLGFNLLCPSIKLEPVKRPLANILLKKIENEGLEAAIHFYREITSSKDNTYDLGYLQLNRLAVHYLDDKDVKTAIKLFKLNIEAYPKFVLCYLALAEAYMIGGEKKKAIETAEKALELDPDNLLAKKLLDHIKEKMR